MSILTLLLQVWAGFLSSLSFAAKSVSSLGLHGIAARFGWKLVVRLGVL